MKDAEAMKGPAKKEWEQAVEQEYNQIVDHGVFEVISMEDVPEDAKILSSTWAMKKKASGTHRVRRLNTRGYEQVHGEHYDEDDKFAPVVMDATIHIVLIIIAMALFWAELLDVKGAFLHGIFGKRRKIYILWYHKDSKDFIRSMLYFYY